jgi:hypothetical protein
MNHTSSPEEPCVTGGTLFMVALILLIVIMGVVGDLVVTKYELQDAQRRVAILEQKVK